MVIDKFANLNREEIAAMLNVDSLKNTRFYREAKEEGVEEGILKSKQETIPRLMKLGLSIEQIAESLELDVDTVRKIALPVKPGGS